MLHRLRQKTRFGKRLWAVLLAVCFAVPAVAGYAQSLPNKITLVSVSNNQIGDISVILDNVRYDHPDQAKPDTPVSGLADLKILLPGDQLPGQDPWITWKDVPFTDVKASLDKDGKAQLKAGGLNLRADARANNILGTGIDLIVKQGSKIIANPDAPGGFLVQITGNMTANLPYYSDKGGQSVFALTNCALNIQPGAENMVSLDVDASMTGPTVNDGVSAFGFILKIQNAQNAKPHLHAVYRKNPTPPQKALDFQVTLPAVSIQTPIPNLLTQDDAPLTLKADSLAFDSDGTFTFKNATLNSPGQVVHLAKPLDFAMTITNASVDWTKTDFTRFSIDADLALPPNFKDINGDRVQMKGIHLDAGQGFYVSFPASEQNPLTFKWNDFIARATAPIIVDLSATLPANPDTVEKGAGDASWEGVYFNDVSLQLPAGFATADGARASIALHECFIDNHGISGFVALSQNQPLNLQVGGFSCGLNAGGLQFQRNEIVQAAVSGYLDFPSLLDADHARLGMTLGIASSGMFSVDLQADANTPIRLSKFGMDLYLTQGSLQVQPDGKTQLKVSGSFAFNNVPALNNLQGAVLQFTDLGVNPDGRFNGDFWMTLAHPVTADFGLFSCDLNQIGFGDEGPGKRWVGFSGGVKLADDIALSGQVDLSQLKVYEGPSLSLGGLHVKATVAEIGYVEGELEQKGAGDDIWLEGQANLGIGIGPGSVSIGGGFVVKHGCWYVTGSAPLGVIPLGDSGLAIFGCQGGVGHNMTLTGNDASKASSWTPAPNAGNFIVQAGVTLGTIDHFTCWGPLTLTIGFPQFLFDLSGTAYVLSPVPTDDRKGTMDLRWNSATSTFSANIGATFKLPGTSLNIIEASGNAELVIGPNNKHLFLGYPPENALKCRVNIPPPGFEIDGGFGIELEPESWIKAFVKAEGHILFLTGEIDGNLDIIFDPNDHHFVQADGSVHAKGGVDIWIASAWGEGDLGAHIKNGAFSVEGDLQVCGHVIILGTKCAGFHFGPWP